MDTKGAVFLAALLVFGTLKNKLEAKIIRDEIPVCRHKTALLPCNGAANAMHRWRIKVGTSPKKKVPNNTGKYQFQNNSLVIKNVGKVDTKNRFYCQTVSADHYRITYIYSLKINCDDVHSFVGGSLILSCDVDISDDDMGKVQWKFRSKTQGKLMKVSSKMWNNGTGVSDGKSRKLIIRNVKIKDSGTYICIVERVKNINLSRGIFSYHLYVDKNLTTKILLPMDTTPMSKTPTRKPMVTTTSLSSRPHTKTNTLSTVSQIASQTSTKTEQTDGQITVSTTKRPTQAVSTNDSSKTKPTIITIHTKTPFKISSPTEVPIWSKRTRKFNTKTDMLNTKAKTKPERPTWNGESGVVDFDDGKPNVAVDTTKPHNSSKSTLASGWLCAVVALVFLGQI